MDAASAKPQRRPPPRIEDFAFRGAEPIRYGDLDRQGHVNNSVFSTFFESGRVVLFDDVATGLDIAGAEVVLARIEIDFLREMRWPGTVAIGTTVASLGRSSFVLDQALFTDGACAATARCVMVMIDTATRKPRPFSAEEASRIKAIMR